MFNRKVEWKYAEPSETLNGEWQANCPSVREHAAKVNKPLLEEEREGLMTQISLRAATERYGIELIIAATGAIEKKGRSGEIRVVFDATNCV